MWPSSFWCKQQQCCGGRRRRSHRSMEDLHDEAAYLNDQLAEINTTEGRITFILRYATSTRQKVVQTTSFGIQSSLMLHLLHKLGGTLQIPVVWIDTGYLPAETYQFASQLSARYQLDLHVYQPHLSAARMEALHGKLWEEQHDNGDDDEAHVLYNTMRKVEPMQRALLDLDASIVLTGLRSNQTLYRQTLQFVNVDDDGRLKVCPILDWSDERVAAYFQQQRLAYHPLYAQGYRTVGDKHSSKPFDPTVHTSERDTRFHGRQQECGLHTSIIIPRRLPTDDLLTAASSSSSSSTSSFSSNESPAVQQQEPESADFVIYGRPSCKYCRQAKALLAGLCQEKDPTLSVASVEVGQAVSTEDLQRVLGRSVQTVPQILYRGSYIGGFEDLLQWCKQKYPTADFHMSDMTSSGSISTAN